MPPQRLYVAQVFREYLTRWYPEAFEHEPYVQLLQELLFPSWRDRWSGKPVFSQNHLASIEGREDLLRGHRYSGESFLARFQEDTGLALTVTDASWRLGQARTAEANWRFGAEQLLSIQLRLQPDASLKGSELVDFYTGRPMAATTLERQRRAARQARQRQTIADTPDVQLLNRVPPHAYTRFAGNFDQAQEIACRLDSPARVHANLRTLFALRQRGLAPTYQAAQNTPRIYARGISMAQLSSKVRSSLLDGAWNLDLVAAQLAIIARSWDLPQWQAMLASAAGDPAFDVWPRVLQAVGLPSTDGNRRAFKTLFYAAAYGMSRRNLRAQATTAFGEEAGAALLRNGLMRELLDGRRERQDRLKAEGKIVDVFGTSVTVAERERTMRGGSAINSLLGHEAQAMELWLMQPIFDKARRDPRFRVVLWLHDGCYVTTGRPPEIKQIEKVAGTVNDRAERAGVVTRLRYKPTGEGEDK